MDTVTSSTLLEGLKDAQNSPAWEQFLARYRPMVASFAKRLGLGHADVSDVCQETMLAFAHGHREGRYDPEKGKLQKWLFGIAYHKAADLKRRHLKEIVVPDGTDSSGFLQSIESPEDATVAWDEEWQRAVLRACLDEVARHVNPSTFKAFELSVFEEWPVAKVAEHLEMTPNAVYIAKNRVMDRILKIRAEMEASW